MEQSFPEKINSIPVPSEANTPSNVWSQDAHAKVAHSKTPDTFAPQGGSSKSRKKSVKPVQHTSINKREFVLKFVKDSSAIVWPKEMKMVNMLFKIAPDNVFWRSLELKFKLNSLCWFLSDEGRKFLNTEYKKFKFEPIAPEKFQLEKNNIVISDKLGETIGAPMTVREFLTLWQKKN
jgi:hypothetical protein